MRGTLLLPLCLPRTMARVVALAILILWLSVDAAAQSGQAAQPPTATTPTLTEVERLRIQVALQRLQIAQLRLEGVQREWEEARQALLARLKEVEREGYELDLETLTYRSKPKPPEPEKRQEKPAESGRHK
jgi:hypothetical protein